MTHPLRPVEGESYLLTTTQPQGFRFRPGDKVPVVCGDVRLELACHLDPKTQEPSVRLDCDDPLGALPDTQGPIDAIEDTPINEILTSSRQSCVLNLPDGVVRARFSLSPEKTRGVVTLEMINPDLFEDEPTSYEKIDLGVKEKPVPIKPGEKIVVRLARANGGKRIGTITNENGLLIFYSPVFAQEHRVLEQEVNVIGRGHQSFLRRYCEYISRDHCQVRIIEDKGEGGILVGFTSLAAHKYGTALDHYKKTEREEK